MRYLILAVMMLVAAAQAGAETYSWVDENGTYNFTEDFSRVPKKYRDSAARRGDMEAQPQPQPVAPRAVVPETKARAVSPQAPVGGEPAPGQESGGLYDGKKAEAWQQQMRPLYGEVKRLEQELVQLEAQIKSPRNTSKESFNALAQQFKESQKQYNDALKKYNELNDAANKAGLPAEFRK